MNLDLHVGDVREGLAKIPESSVQCCVTSPPYWGLRDYGVEGQIGLEETPEAFVETMVEVFRGVRRVLRVDGTCWVNLGDSYAGSWGAQGRQGKTGALAGRSVADARRIAASEKRTRTGSLSRTPGLKSKDLCGIPWRVAFALQADGWFLRSDIVWHKPNPMPESVTDRPTKSHEYVFLLSKSSRYYYDHESIREEPKPWNDGAMSAPKLGDHRKTDAYGQQTTKRYEVIKGANARTVWTIASQPFPGAHFATFPEELPARCIKAGTSERGACPACGAPWRRTVEKGEADIAHRKACGANAAGAYEGKATKEYAGTGAQDPSAVKARILEGMRKRSTVGWSPSCDCPPADPVPCVVLDPFTGAGTTALVAIGLGRRFTGCELNPKYAAMARARVQREVGIFAAAQKETGT